jgi:tetratricopeptide (TPR) repeat protein
MKAYVAAVPCLILAAVYPAMTSQGDSAEKVHAARVSEERGDFADAERILLIALNDAASFGPDDPRKGLILYRLGSVYHSQGRYLNAETCYRNAIQVWKRVPGTDALPLTQSMRNLAALYLETGQYSKAEHLGLESLLTTVETTRPDSSLLAGLTGTLGALASAKGEYREAETHYRRALALWEKLAPNSRERLQILVDLGILYYEQARYTEARTCYERALVVAENVAPRDRLTEVILLANMGTLELKTHRSAEATVFYKKALALGESALGPEHPAVGEVLLSYSVVLRLAKQKAQAKASQRRAEAILKASNRDVRAYTVSVPDLVRSRN